MATFLDPNVSLNQNFTLTPQTSWGTETVPGTGFLSPNTNVISPVGAGMQMPDSGGGLSGFLQSDGFRTGLQGVQSLANLWNAFQANKLARQQFRFTRNFANANLANQTQSYNTALEDRARSRGVMEGRSQAEVDSYIAANRLKDRTV